MQTSENFVRAVLRAGLVTAIAGLAACTSVLSAISRQTETGADMQTLAATSPSLTPERLYASPSLSGPGARSVKYSPDGKRVTFLKARADEQTRFDLWQFDVASGSPSLLVDSKLLEPEEIELSEAEKAMRERRRIAGVKGIADYYWGTAETILIPLGGDLHLVTLTPAGPQTRQLTQSDAFEYDARVSPGGRYVSLIRDGALYAIELATGKEQRLSPPAQPDKAVSYGVAEFVAQEEMSRYTGYWWSPDDRFVAYTRVDESGVQIIPRFDIAADKVTVIEQRYPRAGEPNAIVDLFVREISTGTENEIAWRQKAWGAASDQYLARVHWTKPHEGAEPQLVVESVGRDQATRDVSLHAPMTRSTQLLYRETEKKWINLSNDFKMRGEDYLVTTEATGFRHIVEIRGNGAVEDPITQGNWAVSALAGTDGETVFFTAFKDTPLENHLYAISPGQQPPKRLTKAGATWGVTMAPDGRSFVGTSSSPAQPPQTGLYRADGSRIAWIEENALDDDHPYTPYLSQHTMPDFGTLTAEDGQTLHYSIQKPPGFDPRKKYPVIVEVYGGPGVQTVTREWGPVTDSFYAQRGYVVFRLDNRGSSNRGKKFEDVIYRRTGGPEVRDQLKGVEWLKAQAFVDGDRIAIQGWSYGGYMTLMVLLQAPPGTFAAAVAGAPVTDWTFYDTFYTERYMDTPQDNAVGYKASSVFPYIDALDSPLLLVHGMADDNVTFDNTTRLMAALQEKGKVFDVMTYPGQRHGIRGEALQVHLMKTRLAFLERHLKGDVP